MGRVVVVGAGVVGLSCAVRLLEAGHEVAVVARDLPRETTSAVAAALWYPYRAYPLDRVLGWAETTYDALSDLAQDEATGVRMRQGTEVLPGDMVVIRTGVVPQWYELENAVQRARYWEAQAGIVKDVIPWIKEKKIAGMAADNISLERQPHPEQPELGTPLHGNILRDLGVYIGEIWWLEDLAAHCASDGRYEFFLAAQPLNIPGAVGSPLNPVAIK